MQGSAAVKVQAQIGEAVALHQQGRLAEAKEIYEGVLKANPKHFDALHLLGVIAYQNKNPQLAVELFKFTASVDLLHVAYKGAGPAVIDVLGGNINLLVANPSSVAQHVQAGKLRAIVLFGAQGVGVLPGVPTAIDAGYPALGDIPEWYGLAVPVLTPAGLVEQLNQDLNTVLSDAAVQKKISALGLNASPSTPAEFADQINRDYARWGSLIQQAGIRFE